MAFWVAKSFFLDGALPSFFHSLFQGFLGVKTGVLGF